MEEQLNERDKEERRRGRNWVLVVGICTGWMYVVCFPLSLYLDFNLISSVEPKLTDKGFYIYVHMGINFNIIITESILLEHSAKGVSPATEVQPVT